jgi:RHS repeat-associated protein
MRDFVVFPLRKVGTLCGSSIKPKPFKFAGFCCFPQKKRAKKCVVEPPIQSYDNTGKIIWQTDYDIYGNLTNFASDFGKEFIPFRQLGQYEDVETGLYYNRFRYYSPETGTYISVDPIGFAGNNPNFYAYVGDSNSWVDVFGLSTVYLRNKETYVGKAKVNAAGRYGNKSTATDIFKGIPNTDVAQGVEHITYERMKIMEASGDLDPMTNGQRPVDMGNKKKTYRRDLGEKWLKDTFGDNFEDVIDKKIKDHYKPLGMCK